MKYTLTVQPRGLDPKQAAKAWYLRVKCKEPWKKVRLQTRTVRGELPGKNALRDAVHRMSALRPGQVAPASKYKNCGRKPELSDREQRKIVEFVMAWRHKRFCTSKYLIQELSLTVGPRTVQRVLNKAGFFWRAVPKKSKLSADELAKRKLWVDAHLHRQPAWWAQNVGLVIDDVTLTTAPKPLSGKKEKHAAQAINHVGQERRGVGQRFAHA